MLSTAETLGLPEGVTPDRTILIHSIAVLSFSIDILHPWPLKYLGLTRTALHQN